MQGYFVVNMKKSFVGALLGVTVVFANTVDCTKITDNQKRLVCYDKMVSDKSSKISDGKMLYAKCVACHGENGQMSALGKSAAIAGADVAITTEKLNAYKVGTLDKYGMGGIMKGQVATLSDDDIKAISEHIATLEASKLTQNTIPETNNTINSPTSETESKPTQNTIPEINDSENWYALEDANLMGEKSKVTLIATGTAISSGFSNTSPSLVIRCNNNRTEVYMSTEYVFLGTQGQTVRIKFDDNKPIKQRWGSSEDGTALFQSSQTISFAKDMMKHDEMVVEFTPHGKIGEQTKFNLKGLSKAIEPLRKACNW